MVRIDTQDDLLDRLGRDVLVCCCAMALVAAAFFSGWIAAGVIGGGVLAGVSLVSLKGSVEGLARFAVPGGAARPKTGRIIAKMVGRYALLVLLAYVMIARLRLPPLGLVAGASSVVAAAAFEAVRLLRKNT